MTDPSRLPPDLAEALRDYTVVIVRSRLTDTRLLIEWLERRRIRYTEYHFSMASADSRGGFGDLQAQLNWEMLPMIFVDGEFIGGEKELYQTRISA